MAAHPSERDLAGAFHAIPGAVAAHKRHAEGLQPFSEPFVKLSDLELRERVRIPAELTENSLPLLLRKRLKIKRGAVRGAAAVPYEDAGRELFAAKIRLRDARCCRVPLPAGYGVICQVRDEAAGKIPPEEIICPGLPRRLLPPPFPGVSLIIRAERLLIGLLQLGPRAEPELLPYVKAAPEEHERRIPVKQARLQQYEGAALIIRAAASVRPPRIFAVPAAR